MAGTNNGRSWRLELLVVGAMLLIGIGALSAHWYWTGQFGDVMPADVAARIDALEEKMDEYLVVKPADVLIELGKLRAAIEGD